MRVATQYASAPCKLTKSSYLFARWHLFRRVGYLRLQQLVDLWPFDLESGVRVTCDSANFSLPRPLCSRVRPNVRDRQTDRLRRQTKASLNASVLWGRKHKKQLSCVMRHQAGLPPPQISSALKHSSVVESDSASTGLVIQLQPNLPITAKTSSTNRRRTLAAKPHFCYRSRKSAAFFGLAAKAAVIVNWLAAIKLGQFQANSIQI